MSGAAYYVYDEAGHLLGEYDASGVPLYEVVWLQDQPVGVIKQTRTGSGATLSVSTRLDPVYADHLNTPRVIVRGSDHAIVWRWDSTEPFGVTAASENPSALGAYPFNLRFPRHVYDRETTGHYNLNRDYSAWLGRYVQSDPIGLEGGINTYAYADGSPTTRTDPLGLATFMCTKPLHGLGDTWGPRMYPESRWNPSPAYHQFLCVKDASGNITCGGQDRSGSAAWSDGKPSDDKWPESGNGACKQEDEKDCVDKCVIKNIGNPKRPRYRIGPQGTDCQEWADDVIKQCQKACKGKK